MMCQECFERVATVECADECQRCEACAYAADFCLCCGDIYQSPTDAYQHAAERGVCRACTEYQLDTITGQG